MKTSDKTIERQVLTIGKLLILAWGICMIAMPLDLIIRQSWQDYQRHKWSMEYGRGYWANQTAIHNAQIQTEIRKHK